ncbi:acyl carrier protein [Candidatus Protofrankia californiensis]|uniref:acyl carrier protein n=1 Tax=Candidatus Protofrankia californiensis TaxID=1839754 RepID=UPI00104173C6|nr:acyl carrier protein [Candidatus Protofrankia californiensis]
MSQLTLDDLRTILREAAGEDESVDLAGDILDTAFTDLGYDSLALLEAAAVIDRNYGITLADDLFTGVETPRQLLAEVNAALEKAA